MKNKLLFICVAVIAGYSNPHTSFSQAFELMKGNNSLATELSAIKSASDSSNAAYLFTNLTIPLPGPQVPISLVNDFFDGKGGGFYSSGDPQSFTRYLQPDGNLGDDPYVDDYDQDIYVNNVLEWKDTLTSDTLGNSFILNLIGGSQGIYGSTLTAEILVKNSLGEISIATRDFSASCFYTLPFYNIYPRKMNVEITGNVPAIQSGDLLLLRVKVKSGAAGRIMYGTTVGNNYLKVLGPLMAPSLSSPPDETQNASVNPLLTWINSDGATSYYLQVSTQSDFSTTVFSDSNIVVTSQQVNNLENSTKYYWHVKAKNFTGTSDWSELWNFQTISNTQAPLIQASNLEVTDIAKNSATIKWNKGNGSRSIVFVKQGTDGTPEPVDNSSYMAGADFGVGSQVASSGWYCVYLGNDSTVAITGLAAQTTYKVMAITFNGEEGDEKYLRQAAVANPATFTTTCDLDYYGSNPEVHLYYKNPTTFDVEITNSHSCGSTTLNFLDVTLTGNSFNITVNAYPNSGTIQGTMSADGNSFSGTYNINYATLHPIYGYSIPCETKSGPWSATRNSVGPAVPVMVAPDNNTVSIPVDLVLWWQSSEGATSYSLQVSKSADFNPLLISENNLITTQFDLVGLDYETTYYWKVSAANDCLNSAWSEVWNFTTSPAIPETPALSLPANAAINQPLNLSLQWNPVAGAAKYSLQVSVSSDFSSTVVNQGVLTSTSYSPAGLAHGTKYYWKVSAYNEGGTSAWSQTWNFTTIPAIPGTPALSLPANAAINQPLNLSLQWNPVAGAATYSLQVSVSSNFSSTVVNQSGLTSTGYSPVGLANGTKYYWKVNATNEGGTSAWSQTWNFTTIPAIPGTPALSSPASGATNQPLNLSLQWNPVDGATTYSLQVSTVPDFTSTVINENGITTTNKSISGLVNGITYFWRVNATNAAGTGSWSAFWSFATIKALPDIPVLMGPINGSTNQPISFALFWNTATRAESYSVQVSVSSDFSSTIVNQSGLTSTFFALSELANSSKYYWKVNATNSGGTSAWSETWDFTTIPAIPGVPALSSPANGSTNQPLNLSLQWNTVVGAATYSLLVSTVPDFSSTVISMSWLASPSFSPSGLANGTKYYWKVNATNTGGTSAWSETWDFITINSVGVSELNLDDHVKMYPNPVSGKITVEFNRDFSEPAIFILYSPSGLTVVSKILPGLKTEIDVSGLPGGIYVAEIRNENQKLFKKLTLE